MPRANVFDSMVELLGPAINLDNSATGSQSRLEKIFAASVYHALSEFTLGTGASFNGEEHRTSALMAYLGACISWYNLFSHLSGSDDDEQLSILWNAQNKKTSDGVPGENTTGGDFGIAIRLEDGSYNLIFFQAKQDSFAYQQHRLDINKVPGKYAADGCITELGHTANIEFLKWCADGSLPERSEGPSHQIVKLATQNEFPFSNQFQNPVGTPALARKNWTHYVVWRDAFDTRVNTPPSYELFEPLCLSLADVKTHLLNALRQATREGKSLQNFIGPSGFLKGINDIPLTGPQVSFAKLLISGMRAQQPGWLGVTLDQAKVLVGHFSSLGVHWGFVERSSGNGPKLAEQMGVRVGQPVLDAAAAKIGAELAESISETIRIMKPGGPSA